MFSIGTEVKFEIAPKQYTNGLITLIFSHLTEERASFAMYVILKVTDNDDAIYYVRTVEQMSADLDF